MMKLRHPSGSAARISPPLIDRNAGSTPCEPGSSRRAGEELQAQRTLCNAPTVVNASSAIDLRRLRSLQARACRGDPARRRPVGNHIDQIVAVDPSKIPHLSMARIYGRRRSDELRRQHSGCLPSSYFHWADPGRAQSPRICRRYSAPPDCSLSSTCRPSGHGNRISGKVLQSPTRLLNETTRVHHARGAAAFSRGAQQRAAKPVIGYIGFSSPDNSVLYLAAFAKVRRNWLRRRSERRDRVPLA